MDNVTSIYESLKMAEEILGNAKKFYMDRFIKHGKLASHINYSNLAMDIGKIEAKLRPVVLRAETIT